MNMTAVADSAASNELFTIINVGANMMVFLAANQKFVSYTSDTNHFLVADKSDLNDAEPFLMTESADGTVFFKTLEDKFVCADVNLEGKLVANRNYVGDWEKFRIINR